MNVSRMQQMAALGAAWWNDSCAPAEVAAAVSKGAVGGTSNPVIVSQAVKSDPSRWLPVLDEFIARSPHASEDELAWQLIAEVGRQAAAQFLPVFEATDGAAGYLSMQVSAKFYASASGMVAHAAELAALGPNIAIKAPATAAGVEAMEEMTARGIRINATVSFSVAQVLAVSAAIARGLERASGSGHDPDRIKPYITLMIGRVDDHLKRVVQRDQLSIAPEVLAWAGIAVFKRAHQLLRERGLPGTLLAAAYRHRGHWSEIIGPDVLQTIPYTWWTQFDVGDHAPSLTLEQPVEAQILEQLRTLPDFCKAYEDGLQPADFVNYGATRHTLQQFLRGYADLLEIVRHRLLPL